jgi:hypothetical protein
MARRGSSGVAPSMRRWVGVFAMTCVVACATEPPVRCRFEASHTLGEVALGVQDVRLIRRGAGLVAFWSAREGLFARTLASDGAPLGEATRLGPACEGGLAVADDERGLVLACSRPANLDKGQDGDVVLAVVSDALELRSSRALATIGRDSRGVDLARRHDGTWSVVWHDGTPGAWNVVRARVRLDDDAPTDVEILSSGVSSAGGWPRVLVRGDEALFVFEEMWFEGDLARGRVLVARERGIPVQVEELEGHDARPQLVHDARSLVLFFRDLRRPLRHSVLFARRLGETLRPMEPARLVTRADAEGSPRSLECLGHLVAVVPRTWDTDVLVGIDLLDARLRKPIPEQQIYEWSARFPHTDAACSDDHLVTLVASRAPASSPGAPLHTIVLRCDDP